MPKQMLPVEDWFEQSKPLKLLKENLEVNLDVIAAELSEEDRTVLARLNLIMIRQCLLDYGVEK